MGRAEALPFIILPIPLLLRPGLFRFQVLQQFLYDLDVAGVPDVFDLVEESLDGTSMRDGETV